MSQKSQYFICQICGQIFEDENLLFNHGCNFSNAAEVNKDLLLNNSK